MLFDTNCIFHKTIESESLNAHLCSYHSNQRCVCENCGKHLDKDIALEVLRKYADHVADNSNVGRMYLDYVNGEFQIYHHDGKTLHMDKRLQLSGYALCRVLQSMLKVASWKESTNFVLTEGYTFIVSGLDGSPISLTVKCDDDNSEAKFSYTGFYGCSTVEEGVRHLLNKAYKDILTDNQLKALERAYPSAYNAYVANRGVDDIYPMIDDIISRYK